MEKVISKDGTSIAYDQSGQGPVVILVGGAFSYRAYPGSVRLAELLSKRFTVINYDRRGRGDSSDTHPYAVEGEIEDLKALIDAVGGSAYLFGMSSGAVLSLRAAASGVNIKKLALYQPPFIVDASSHQPPPNFESDLKAKLAAGRRGDAVKLFLTKGMGMPAIIAAIFRFMPVWSKLTAVAHTLPYDFAVMGETVKGKPLAAKEWAPVTIPTLAMDGEKSPATNRQAVQALVDILPNAQRRTVEGQSHNVSMDVLAPVLDEFFSG